MSPVFPTTESSLTLLETAPLRAWAYNRQPPALMEGAVRISPGWRQLVRSLSFRSMRGRPGEAYFVWEIDDQADFRNALVALNTRTQVVNFVNSRMEENVAPKRALVCWVNSAPYGDFIASMISRPERLLSLVVMFYGHRNANPCDHCAKRYATYVCTGRTNDNLHLQINWPFFECISHPDLSSGKCANCIYHVHSDCDYNMNYGNNNQFECVKNNAAKRDGSPEMAPRKFITSLVNDPIDTAQAFREVKELNKAAEVPDE